MFSTLKKLLCFKKEPRNPLGFCDSPSSERQRKFFWCGGANEDRYCQSYDPENPFHEVVCAGKLKEALHLLTRRYFNVKDKDTGKRTDLHFTFFYGHLDLVYFLLHMDSETNALDKKKATPLMKVVHRLNFIN
ncbi:ankyrin repeat domain-containing protein 30A-like [Mesocricetus auratus]|uniref:Ankyrin repeat domain-containing protein 30A-like n=1 Tax=Mesocricetus auratus TaxID=10036 RepID=A0ABM2WE92_MESAU|nr:ankyrin repeat domain-containing protein 30A-like [Mesocricetus auratus]